MTWLWILLVLPLLCVLGLLAWRWKDRQRDRRIGRDLMEWAGPPHTVFDHALLEGLPDPAQRYFRYMIAEGTPLVSAAEIEMEGELGLGTLNDPKYTAMHARQILAPPHGLVWELTTAAVRGSDGVTPHTSWTQFWLANVIPIVRVGGGTDHHRSAFGRVVSEGAFWVPASLLPSGFVRWEAVDQNTARALVSYAGFEQAVEITVAESGQPTQVVIPRWSNENPERLFREQPFGGYLSEFRQFGGYTLPTRVTGGNHFGTKDYFPFYKAAVNNIRFPEGSGESLQG